MAAAIGTANQQILVIKWQDFRGQTFTQRIEILGSLSDSSLASIIDDLDAVSNARMLKVYVESVRPVTGTKTTAANAIERNISEVMALAFQGIDGTTTPNKIVTKKVLIPAMIGAIELIDGSPDPANAALSALTGALQLGLVFKLSSGNISGPITTYVPSESHHVSLADVVDSL